MIYTIEACPASGDIVIRQYRELGTLHKMCLYTRTLRGSGSLLHMDDGGYIGLEIPPSE